MTSSSVARKAATSVVGRSATNPTVSERMTLGAMRQLDLAERRVERREQAVFGEHVGLGQRVEERRLAGIRVADQRDDRMAGALAVLALQAPARDDRLELALDLGDAVADHPPVGLDLRLAGAAEEAEAAALALKMGPAADQPALLVVEMRQLDLQRAFPRLRALAEDLEDQAGAVDDLGLPGLLEIALLDRGQRVVDDTRPTSRPRPRVPISSTLPVPNSVAGRKSPSGTAIAVDDVEVDRLGKPTASSTRAAASRSPRHRRLPSAARHRHEDERPLRRPGGSVVAFAVRRRRRVSVNRLPGRAASSGSKSCRARPA